MAHEVVTVCLGAAASEDLAGAIGRALAPFDYNGDHEPYQGEWDHWWLGRGTEFDVVPGHEDDPRLVRAPRDGRWDDRPWDRRRCDGGPRGLLDFAGMRARAAREADKFALDFANTDPYAHGQPVWVLPTHHLLSLEGEWATFPDLGDWPGYLKSCNAYLDALPADTMVVRLRIHC